MAKQGIKLHRKSDLEKGEFLVVAAIDFGTTYSGYAYSFIHSPMEIQSSHTWYAGTSSLASMKAPTCLLLNSDQSFDSFGYEAEDKFANIAADNLQGDYFFFTRFKMDLYRKVLIYSLIMYRH
jgi:hypothetical protein